jgi:hypothetical protein
MRLASVELVAVGVLDCGRPQLDRAGLRSPLLPVGADHAGWPKLV